MRLVGEFSPTTRSEFVVGWLLLIVVVAFLLPWVAIAVGCVLAGIAAIARGEYAMVICLPAGVALLVLPALLFYLDSRWYRRISGFVLDEESFTYSTSRETVCRSIDDVRWVTHRMHRGRTRGYLVKFHDGGGIFVCKSLSNADDLARILKESVSKASSRNV